MSDLIVIVYPKKATAEAARQRLTELQKEYLTGLGNSAFATGTESDKVKLKQSTDTDPVCEDLLIGALFLSPLNILTSDSASSALDALTEAGLNNAFVKKLSKSLERDSGALVLLVHLMTAGKMLEEIEGFGGVVLKTQLDETKEQILRDALQRASG